MKKQLDEKDGKIDQLKAELTSSQDQPEAARKEMMKNQLDEKERHIQQLRAELTSSRDQLETEAARKEAEKFSGKKPGSIMSSLDEENVPAASSAPPPQTPQP